MKGARIVTLGSVMHHMTKGPHDEEYWKKVCFYGKSKFRTYEPSKLAALYFSMELNRRYGESHGIRSITVNPGAVNSDVWRGSPLWKKILYKVLFLSTWQGCHTSVAAIVEDWKRDVSYLQPYWLPSLNKPAFPPFEMMGPFVGCRATAPRLSPEAQDYAKALWRVCSQVMSSTAQIDMPNMKEQPLTTIQNEL